jgi:hypothetical protein
MPYGEGDYGEGDYGAGDFLGIGKRLKKIGRSILHHIPGYDVASAAIGGLSHHHAKAVIHSNFAAAGGGSIATAPVLMGQAGIPTGTTETDVGYGLFKRKTVNLAPGGGGSGYHVIRRGAHAGMMTRNRRMHVTNPKALRRAIRRARGFEKLARKVMGFTTPHKPKGRPYFRAHRKSK